MGERAKRKEQSAWRKEQVTGSKEKTKEDADKMICLIGSIGSIVFRV